MILTIFDYIFYRVAMYFFKRDGTHAPRAIVIVSLIQCLYLSSLIVTISRLIYSTQVTSQYSKLGGQLAGAIIVILVLLNYWRYKRWYSKFNSRWRNSETPTQKKVRGYLVFLGILFPMIIMIFWGLKAT